MKNILVDKGKNRMKEKMVENLLAKLVCMCGLGKIIADVESVSGGLMHRMYKIITDSGVYAVKHLNAEIMKRPGVHENYARAEKIEGILENNDISIVPAMVIGGKKMQKIDDQFFYVFRWQEGKIADWNRISNEMCFKAGNILGRIHAIEPKNIEYQAPETSHIDWQGYVVRAKEENSAIASLLEDNEGLLVCVENELNKARASLPAISCLSNEDMDPKNIMWDNGIPWMIDLECLDYGNPISHVMQLALQWSGIVTCEMDLDKMIAFFDGYLEAYDNCFRGYSDVVGVAYTWVEWFEYNIQRALGKCTDEAERELGISEVRNTMDRIKYIHKIVPQIREALDTRLPKFSFETLDQMLGDHAPFLISLSDGLQEELHVIISAAEVGDLGDNIPNFEGVDETARQALQGILAESRSIEMNENCLFEVCFHDYIIYQIRNESFWSGDPNEIRHGKYLIIFEKSKLLSHLEEITDAQQLDDGSFYPGKWTHYGIYTQTHVIDVISHCPPDVSRHIK